MDKRTLLFLITATLILAGAHRLFAQTVDSGIDGSIGAGVTSDASSSYVQASAGLEATASGRRATGFTSRGAGDKLNTGSAGSTPHFLNGQSEMNSISARTRRFLRTHRGKAQGINDLEAQAYVPLGVSEHRHVQSSTDGNSTLTQEESGHLIAPAGSHSRVRYTDNFPDSTRGTAVISPPDTGTLSPLEWTPGPNFELPAFGQGDLLKPNLHVAGKRRRRSRSGRRHRTQENGMSTSASPFPSLTGTGSQSLADTLPDDLSQPAGQSLLSAPLGSQ